MPISAVDAISPAFEHARQQLTRPFRASQWAKLGLVGLLAGEMGSGGGGGCNPGSFQMPHPNHSQRLLDTGFPAINPMLTASLIAVLVVAGFVLLILFLYVNSVMRFVLFDSVVAKECRIWQSWVRRQGPGRRFFVWQILLGLVSIMGLTILVGIPAGFAFLVGWLKDPKEHMIPLILGGMALFFVLFCFSWCRCSGPCDDQGFRGPANGAGRNRRLRRLAAAVAPDQRREARLRRLISE